MPEQDVKNRVIRSSSDLNTPTKKVTTKQKVLMFLRALIAYTGSIGIIDGVWDLEDAHWMPATLERDIWYIIIGIAMMMLTRTFLGNSGYDMNDFPWLSAFRHNVSKKHKTKKLIDIPLPLIALSTFTYIVALLGSQLAWVGISNLWWNEYFFKETFLSLILETIISLLIMGYTGALRNASNSRGGGGQFRTQVESMVHEERIIVDNLLNDITSWNYSSGDEDGLELTEQREPSLSNRRQESQDGLIDIDLSDIKSSPSKPSTTKDKVTIKPNPCAPQHVSRTDTIGLIKAYLYFYHACFWGFTAIVTFWAAVQEILYEYVWGTDELLARELIYIAIGLLLILVGAKGVLYGDAGLDESNTHADILNHEAMDSDDEQLTLQELSETGLELPPSRMVRAKRAMKATRVKYKAQIEIIKNVSALFGITFLWTGIEDIGYLYLNKSAHLEYLSPMTCYIWVFVGTVIVVAAGSLFGLVSLPPTQHLVRLLSCSLDPRAQSTLCGIKCPSMNDA